jgi:hypothetical protein
LILSKPTAGRLGTFARDGVLRWAMLLVHPAALALSVDAGLAPRQAGSACKHRGNGRQSAMRHSTRTRSLRRAIHPRDFDRRARSILRCGVSALIVNQVLTAGLWEPGESRDQGG